MGARQLCLNTRAAIAEPSDNRIYLCISKRELHALFFLWDKNSTMEALYMKQKVYIHKANLNRPDLVFLALDSAVSKGSICETKQKEMPINVNFGSNKKRKRND